MTNIPDNDHEDHYDDPDHDQRAIFEVASGSEATERFSAERVLIAKRRVAIRSINLPFSQQEDLRDALDEAWCGADDLRTAGLPQPIVAGLGDSFFGKTTTVTGYAQGVRNRYQSNEKPCPVIYTKVDTDGTVGSLATDILRGMGERRPDSLTPEKRWNRARQAIRDREISLLILDEFQRAGRRPTISPVIAGKLLDIADSGECALAFIGKHSSEQVFKSCPDLKNRLDAPVRMNPLRWDTDKAEFRTFVDRFDQALVDAGIIRIKSGFADEKIAQLLLEACRGSIGQFSRIIETAVIAITREGHEVITRQDLSDAVGDWSIPSGRINYNPFTICDTQKTNGCNAPARGSEYDDDVDDDVID